MCLPAQSNEREDDVQNMVA